MHRESLCTPGPASDSLRAAGCYLDQQAQGRRLLSLALVAEGIVVVLAAPDIRHAAEAVLLPHDTLRTLAAQARALRGHGNAPSSPHALFPTGYEDFLRALRVVVQRHGWTELRLVALEESALLHYGDPPQRQGIALTADDIRALLDRAFRRRGCLTTDTASDQMPRR